MMSIVSATRWRSSVSTHTGHRREVNEDSVLAMPEVGLWALSDGMGGHTAGDFASETVISQLASIPLELEPAERLHAARSAIQTAHQEILGEAANRGGATIGATVVVLVMATEHFACLWAGDSRLYRMRGQELQRISRDHSIVADLVATGQLAEEDAESHPQANQITRAVGIGSDLRIDKRRGDAMLGDRFLLCSDGLTQHVTDSELAEAISVKTVEHATEDLLALALDRGGADNVSVIVAEA